MVLKLIAAGILAAVLLINYGSATNFPVTPSEYPNFERDESQRGKYPDGTPVIDPYRSLEELENPKTKEFIAQEIDFTNKYLQKGAGLRKPIEDRYQELWKIEKYEGPFRKGEKYFSYRNNGSEKQDVLYVQNELTIDQGEVFLNPNNFEAGVTLDKVGSAFSEDGSIFAYLTSKENSVGKTLQFKRVTGDDDCDEKLTEITSITWAKDNTGIFYWFVKEEASDESDETKKYGLRYHELGSQQREDKEVAVFPINADFVSSKVSDDGKYLVVNASVGTDEQVVYLANLSTDVTKEQLKLEPLIEWKDNYEFITNKGNDYIFLTNRFANNYELAVMNISSREWSDFVPADYDNNKILDWAAVAGDKFVLGYIEDNRSVLQLHDKNGKLLDTFKLDIGTVRADTFYSDKKSSDIYFKFESFLIPGIIYHCNVLNSPIELKPIKEITVPNFNRENYDVKLAIFESKDETDIRMHIVYKRELKQDGNNFAFLTTEGVLNVENLPYFSVNRVAVVDNLKGVHAVVYVRKEDGLPEDRYAVGMLEYAPMSVADFVAAAEYLIDNQYTNSQLLAADGSGSGASGPLMGAVLNRKPDLFGAVITEAGLTDMYRFDKSPIGRKWISEYGSPENKNTFEYLKEFSPLHKCHVDETEYPATLILTSENDDRVPALHSLKFAATLQYQAKKRPEQTNPLLLDVSKSNDITVKEAVDMTLFAVMNTGVEFHASG